MDKNLPNDQLESFLRDELGKVNESPPDFVWDKIAANAPKKQDDRPGRLLWKRRWAIAASFLLLAAASWGLWHRHLEQLKLLDEQVARQERRIQNLEAQVDTLELKMTGPLLDKKAPSTVLDELVSNEDGKQTGAQTTRIKERQPTAVVRSSVPIATEGQHAQASQGRAPYQRETAPIIYTNNTPPIFEENITNNNTVVQNLHAEQRDLAVLRTFDYPIVIVHQHSIPLLQKVVSPEARIQVKMDKPLSIGIYFSPLYSFRDVDDGYMPPPRPSKELDEEESPLFSCEAGLNASWHFAKRWSLRTGLAYANVRQRSQPQFIKIDYDKDSEQQTTDGLSSKYVVDVNTSYGNHKVHCELVRDRDHPIDQGEHVDLALQIDEQLQTLGVPLQIGYGIPLGSRISLNLFGGSRYNYLLDSKVRIGMFKPKERHDAFVRQDAAIAELDSVPGLKKHQFDLQVGAELSYHFAKKLSVSVAPTYRHALTPIYSNDDALSTKPYALGVQVGMSYRF
jgi:hypothetical protein